jgi:hypothetical protein
MTLAMLYGQVNRVSTVLPHEFWALTPIEAGMIVAGGAFREEREWERFAFLASCVMNVSGKTLKREITPEQLLGRPRKIVAKDPGSKEAEFLARAEALDREHGG